ncbi:MAG: type II toxin-antitoxin system HicA family toxin [Deltaproteobacteria bacterium]|nr:type II toxin-antitoxin system HicA family toxin [Deltaproteobacteria bacterium]
MKRTDLLRRLRRAGVELLREGGSHTIFCNPRTGRLIPVPRHTEINERLAE